MEKTKVAEVLADFVSVASFQRVARIVSSGWTEHAPFAFWLVDALKPQCLVELGVHQGFSYLTMCQAASHLTPRPRCYGVDNWQGDAHAGFYGPEVLEKLRTYHDPLYSDFSQLVQSPFDDLISRFADHSIDLLHIDGRHFYEDVKHDFESWRPKLSRRAVVLFHDTNVRDQGFGVWRLWKEIEGQYPSFEFTHGYGLGVLGFGAGFPVAIDRLFAASKDRKRAQTIRSIYRRLGAPYPEILRYHEATVQAESMTNSSPRLAR